MNIRHEYPVLHAPSPLQPANTLCGETKAAFAPIGHTVNCPQCRVVINFTRRNITGDRYMLVRNP